MKRLGAILSGIFRKYMPDPFVLVIVLTLLALTGGMVVKKSFVTMVGYWQEGFWDSLAFGMQFCILIVAGHALAMARPVRRLLALGAERIKSPFAAIFITGFVSCLFANLHWGLGLIAGAFIAREIGVAFLRRKQTIHYPLLVAAAYCGLMIWHAGISGEAPLMAAKGQVGLGTTIPLTETLLASSNMLISTILLFFLPLCLTFFHPKDRECEPPSSEQTAVSTADRVQPGQLLTLAGRLERFWLISALAGIAGLACVLIRLLAAEGKAGLHINDLNFTLIFLGILLHWTPRNYMNAVLQGTKGAGTVVLQFPFYAGLAGMLVRSGLVRDVTILFAGHVGPNLLAPAAFLSAGVINVFMPWGGIQWTHQGAELVRLAQAANVPPSKVVLALAYGDGWTNMIQPFFALPLLAITRVEARDIFGYTAALLIPGGLIFCLGLLLL